MTTAEIVAAAAAGIALISAVAAWGAIIANRKTARETVRAQVNIAARNSRATVVSANRQKWIDAIREDVADFIAIRSHVVSLKFARGFEGAGRDAILTEERELRAKIVMLYARIEMRLNHEEDNHLNLLAALSRYDQEASDEAADALRAAGRKIFSEEWKRLKKEASGIDPFVKEAPSSRHI